MQEMWRLRTQTCRYWQSTVTYEVIFRYNMAEGSFFSEVKRRVTADTSPRAIQIAKMMNTGPNILYTLLSTEVIENEFK